MTHHTVKYVLFLPPDMSRVPGVILLDDVGVFRLYATLHSLVYNRGHVEKRFPLVFYSTRTRSPRRE